jgi:FkbM family methyltransferase
LASAQDPQEKKATAQPADTTQPQLIKFDSVNVLVDNTATPEHIDLLLSVPLEDGTLAETKFSLSSPTRTVGKSGKYEYNMQTNSALFITPMEKKADGAITMMSNDGLSWEMPSNYPGAGTALLVHEPKVKDFLVGRFSAGEVFVDVGANVGAYSLRAASSGMKVYSFEPNTETVRILRRNAEINHLTVEVMEVALGAENGTVKFAPFGGTSRVTPEGTVDVPIRTLDSYELPSIDLMKVDVEGYELDVLKGAKQTLARCRPTLMIEMHHWLGAMGEAELFNILIEAGYVFQYLDRYAQGRHLIAYSKASVRPPILS